MSHSHWSFYLKCSLRKTQLDAFRTRPIFSLSSMMGGQTNTLILWQSLLGGCRQVNAAQPLLRRMAAENYHSAQLVFGWSFYRQGTSGSTSSADEFLDAALISFGDPDAALGLAWRLRIAAIDISKLFNDYRYRRPACDTARFIAIPSDSSPHIGPQRLLPERGLLAFP